MLYHYLGLLDSYPSAQKQEWIHYLNSWQDPASGYYLGPEIVRSELNGRRHSYEHIAQHLTCHVLPTLNLLGEEPKYPLSFARAFADLDFLRKWLDARDWREAWLEGNNLLFVGQLLIHLRDVESLSSAQKALDLYFEWLGEEMDPETGLWGSNGYCSRATALYGGYHQLLVYYHENRPLRHPEHLIEVALSLQHADGGFNPDGGGGACEDADAVDILVNMYKYVDYKRSSIRIALRAALKEIMSMQMPDGGFVYRLNQPFIHMGIKRTASPANQSNLFPTWFRVHTLALISQVLSDESIARYDWKFNKSCSMGWHRPWDRSVHSIDWGDRQREHFVKIGDKLRQTIGKAFAGIHYPWGRIKRLIVGFLQNV